MGVASGANDFSGAGVQISPFLLRLLHSVLVRLLRGLEYRSGGSACHVNAAALRADGCVICHRLGEDFLVLPLRLGLRVGHVFQFMGANGGRRAFRADAGGRFEGDARVVGAVLIFAVFAGLALVSVEITPVWDSPIVFRLLRRRVRGGFFRWQVCILRSVCHGNLDGIIESLLIER